MTGPTLLFLKEQVGVTMSEISYIFTARSLGTLGGAFIGMPLVMFVYLPLLILHI